MTDAFDADVLIYAAQQGHPLGQRVRSLLVPAEQPTIEANTDGPVGSVLLLPELLSKPLRNGLNSELEELAGLIGRLQLHEVSRTVASLATTLGAKYSLRAVDAVHLATAATFADRFITNNTEDFVRSISEVDIVYPGDLPEPT